MSNNDQPRDATMHDAQLSALYQRARNDEPPVHLDAAIRAAAHREVAAGPQRARWIRWRVPLALAATVVLGISVVTVLRQQEAQQDHLQIAMVERAPIENQIADERNKSASPSPPESVPAQPEPGLEIKDTPRALAVPKKSVSVQAAKSRVDEQVARAQPAAPESTDRLNKAEAGSSIAMESHLALVPTVAPEAKAKFESRIAEIARDQVETPALNQERDERTINSQAMEPTTAGERAMADARAKRSAPAAPAAMAATGNSPSASRSFEAQNMTPSLAKTDSPKPIGPWLKEIAKLRVEGRDQESARQLQLFKQTYPDIPGEKISTSLATYEREWRDASKTTRAAPDSTDDKK